MKNLEIYGKKISVLTVDDIYAKKFKIGDEIKILLTSEDSKNCVEVSGDILNVDTDGDESKEYALPIQVRIYANRPDNRISLKNSFLSEALPLLEEQFVIWVGCGIRVSTHGFTFHAFITTPHPNQIPALFKDGDFVYFPRRGAEVFELKKPTDDPNMKYPLSIEEIGQFTEDGKLWVDDKVPSIWPATAENQKKLSEFYGMTFEEPIERIDTISKLLPCLCLVSDSDMSLYSPKDFNGVLRSRAYLHVVTAKTAKGFETEMGPTFNFARPCKVNLDGSLEFVDV